MSSANITIGERDIGLGRPVYIIAELSGTRADFELWSLAVSAINGCGMCIESHEKAVRQAGITAEQVQAAVRIASVVNAAAAVLDAEAVSAQQPAALAA